MMNDAMTSSYDSIVGLCFNKNKLQESELISQLRAILNDNPNVVYEQFEDGWTLLHHATRDRSPEFCRVLVSQNEGLVRTTDYQGCLPFYKACSFRNFKAAKYLVKLYPESISIADDDGYTPLHGFLYYNSGSDTIDAIELLQLLLQNDQGAVSTRENGDGQLPLHVAILEGNCDAKVKLVFNAYPEAIYIEDYGENTPLDCAREMRNRHEMVHFFQQQIDLERQARTNTIPDNNGQLPIHRALQNRDASLGGIKLMLAANQASIAVMDNQGHTPFHVACLAGNLDAFNFFIGVDRIFLQTVHTPDSNDNLPLHLACMGGNGKVISCILEQSTYVVALQNSDNRTPIELLLFESQCDRDSMDYIEAIRCLFYVNPVDTLKCLVKDKNGKPISEVLG